MPKSSIASRRPISFSRVEHLADAERVGEDRRLGDLELELLRRDAGLGEERRDPVGELEVEQVGDRQVHRDVEVVARARSTARTARAPRRARARERLDETGALRDRDELVRRDEPALGVLPADERLRAHDAAGLELGLGLEVDDELALLDRPAELAGEREAGRVVRVLLDVVRGRPACESFATYIATSARWSSVSTSSPCSG